MFIKFALTYWKQILLILIFTIQSLSIWYYKNQYALSQKDYQNSQQALNSLGNMVIMSKTDYNNNIEIAKKKSVTTKIKYVNKIQYIDREIDNNVTCKDAINMLDNYQY